MSLTLLLGLSFAPLLATTVSAQPSTPEPGENPIQTGLDDGTCLGDQAACPDEGTATGGVQGMVGLIINILSWIVGVVAVIMIIVGGFKYITSGGDSGNVTSAKNTILYAIVGLVIVALAQVIVRFVLNTSSGAFN